MYAYLHLPSEGGFFVFYSVAEEGASHRALARVPGKVSRIFVEDACVKLVELCLSMRGTETSPSSLHQAVEPGFLIALRQLIG